MRKVPSLLRGGTELPVGLARVLLVHGELAPRLALQTILQASGYSVDSAATPAEALSKLDECQYELVLSDTRVGANVLAYARVKEYRPATALVNSYEPLQKRLTARPRPHIAIRTENLPSLLETVAGLIGARACRRNRLATAQ